MATQQGVPSRPWFRLATMVRPPPTAAPTPQSDQAPPPAPAPALGPRPAFIRPAFSQSIRPPPPPPQPQPTFVTNGVAPATSSPTPPQPLGTRDTSNEPRPLRLQQWGSPTAVRTSPSPPPPPTITSPTNTTRPTTPTSPNINRNSQTPSPLALPSPRLKSYNSNQPEYEQKTVLVQETKEKPKMHSPKPNSPKKPEPSKNRSDSEDFGMSIITIAGENKGAIMDLTPSDKRTHNFGNNLHRLHAKDHPTPTSSDGEKSGSNSDGNSNAKNKNRKSKSPLMNAIMNSNVQGVNNSLLLNSSTTHHDPGIHLSNSRKPNVRHRF